MKTFTANPHLQCTLEKYKLRGLLVYLQGEQCHNLATQLKKQYPDMAAPVLIEAAQFVKEKKADQAQKLLNVSVFLHFFDISHSSTFLARIYNVLDSTVLFY